VPVVGVKELKEKTSKLIKDLKENKKFILTVRGRPVAKILPISEEEYEDYFFSSANVSLMEILDEREKEFSISLKEFLKQKK